MPSPIALKVGAVIGAYKIQKVLATTPYGVLYRATAKQDDHTVNIQEFLPREFAARSRSGNKVRARKGKEHALEDALTLFLQEARILAQIHDPYVARVHEYTETNGTAYLVMEHDPGQSLAAYLKQHDAAIGETELRNVLVPVLKGLRVVHNAQLLHRDITPTAIYLRRNGPPLLSWFGACHRSPKLESSLDHRVTPGYSPIELYHENPRLKPASDLYSLGAVMYRCIAGSPPVDPTQRLAALAQDEDDPLVPASELGRGDYSNSLLGTIDWMLQPMLQDRPDSAGAVLGPLTSSGDDKPARSHVAPSPPSAVKPSEAPKKMLKARPEKAPAPHKRGKTSTSLILASTLAASALALWLAWPLLGSFLDSGVERYEDQSNDTKDPPAESTSNTDSTVAGPVPEEANVDGPGAEADTQGPDMAGPALNDPNIIDPPPEVPDTVKFTRSGDDERAAQYREIERRESEIEQLLKAARLNIAEGKPLIALPQLRRVQAIDANNADAKESLTKIADQLLTQARRALENGNMNLVDQLLEQVESISPGYFAVEQFRQRVEQVEQEQKRLELEKQQAEQRRQEMIAELLRKAETATTQNHFIEPPGINALEHYREILKLDPENKKARDGIGKVALVFLERANRALAADDFDRAEGHLNIAAAIEPENPAIKLLRSQVETRRAEAQKRAAAPVAVAPTPPPAPAAATPAPAAVAPPQSPARRVTAESQKQKQLQQDLERGIQAYYAGSYDKARRLLSTLAQKGYPRAQFRLGMMYYLGRGVAQNRLIAEDWFRKALPEVRRLAQQGEAWAQADLGSLYEDGLIVEPDTESAVRWYTRAAEQGYPGAQTNLGVMYAKGIGVESNIIEAIKWFERAAAQGDRVARENLLTLRSEE